MIRASAPGKLMLTGEHAVLHGRLALVGAVDQRFTVELSPRTDNQVTISSDLGNWQGALDTVKAEKPFQFILEAIRRAEPAAGFDLNIISDFRDDVGLGSSSAVTVATVAALDRHNVGGAATPRPGAGAFFDHVFTESLAVVRAIQGSASGADLAAAVYGGAVAYRTDPLEITPLDGIPPIAVVYSGSKMKTADVIALVEAKRREDPDTVDQVFDAMAACSERAFTAVNNRDWPTLGNVFNTHQELMARLGVSNDALDAIVQDLLADPGIHGAKISGAGLGDCVIGVGRATQPHRPPVLDVQLSASGLRFSE